MHHIFFIHSSVGDITGDADLQMENFSGPQFSLLFSVLEDEMR